MRAESSSTHKGSGAPSDGQSVLMGAASEYVLEPLREGAELSLYRGRDCGNQTPILAVAVAAERPSPQSLRRLEYEYSLAAELDGAWAAQPLALTRHQGRTMLLLKDPGGELLDRLIAQHNGQWADLDSFLRVAIGLAAALGHAHRHGLIHKDVKPENVLVGEAGHVWLTGFGIASRLPRERLVPASPEVIAGTLAYMSPEQTGRMNRSLDTRSDLYSLGVTLYQMLTGALPFWSAQVKPDTSWSSVKLFQRRPGLRRRDTNDDAPDCKTPRCTLRCPRSRSRGSCRSSS